MVRAFTDQERTVHRLALMGEGRRLFIQGGFKEVSLSRIADAAGIAKASFYAFFPSKEDLILDLLAAEAPTVSARVLAPLTDSDLGAAEALSMFLRALLKEYADNAFLARLVAEPDVLSAIARRVRPEDLERKAAWMERPLNVFFKARVASREFAPRSHQTFLDLVKAVSLLSLHRDRFGSATRFEAAAGVLIDIMAQGLTNRDLQHDC